DWGVSLDDVYKQSIKNMPDCIFENIGDHLLRMLSEEQKSMMLVTEDAFTSCVPPLWVLSNFDLKRPYGASQILNIAVLNSIRKTFGSDYYMIPSSIHEWILAPCDIFGDGAEEELLDLCSSINVSDVQPEDVLGSFILKYDGKEVTKVA
ncbi:MAG: hypothetical protein IK121_05910, partial [Lachnospiraceae bacterium]|nr:hypothetical protein [Lachnospiraceae bacterium]